MINNFFSPYGMKIDIVTNYVIQIKSFLCPYTVTSQFANIPKFSFFSRNILIEIVAFTFVCYFVYLPFVFRNEYSKLSELKKVYLLFFL